MSTQEYIEVKNSGIHNNGVFATRNIHKGEIITEYLGRLINKEESEKIQNEMIAKYKNDSGNNAATYIFIISPEEDLDGDIPENDARYINHSCNPNCEYMIDGKRVFIRTIREIKEGEEITYNYGFELDEKDVYEFKEHPCRCGSKNCVGYILSEDEWPKMRELLDKEKNKQ